MSIIYTKFNIPYIEAYQVSINNLIYAYSKNDNGECMKSISQGNQTYWSIKNQTILNKEFNIVKQDYEMLEKNNKKQE